MGEKVFMQGNAALSESAIRAGCKMFFGYPITPSSEMPEYYAAEAPKRDLVFVQAETEVAAFNMIAGAAAAGKRAMTGTAGPGFSLGQEAMSYMAAAGLPAVVVNVMRPGPADGEILGSQGDYFQAVKGGGHGDYNVICMTPYSVQEQADMIQELFPDAKTVGLLYCSAEPNSSYQVGVIKPLLEEMGYTCTEYAFADSNDVASVTTSACASSDVIYIPTDNTAASCTEAIRNVVVPAGVPVVAGEQGICSGCGVATLSIDYYALGQLTGEMGYDIVVNGKDPGTMEIQSLPTATKMYNPSVCEELNITPPEGYTAIETTAE